MSNQVKNRKKKKSTGLDLWRPLFFFLAISFDLIYSVLKISLFSFYFVFSFSFAAGIHIVGLGRSNLVRVCVCVFHSKLFSFCHVT